MKVQLKNLATMFIGTDVRNLDNAQNADTLQITKANFEDYKVQIKLDYSTKVALKSTNSKPLQNGDVLLQVRGFVNDKNKRACGVIRNLNKNAIASSQFVIIRIDQSKIIPEYLAWFLKLDKTEIILKSWECGTTQPNISKSQIMGLEVPVLTIAKQEKIIETAKLFEQEQTLTYELLEKKAMFVSQTLLNIVEVTA